MLTIDHGNPYWLNVSEFGCTAWVESYYQTVYGCFNTACNPVETSGVIDTHNWKIKSMEFLYILKKVLSLQGICGFDI